MQSGSLLFYQPFYRVFETTLGYYTWMLLRANTSPMSTGMACGVHLPQKCNMVHIGALLELRYLKRNFS